MENPMSGLVHVSNLLDQSYGASGTCQNIVKKEKKRNLGRLSAWRSLNKHLAMNYWLQFFSTGALYTFQTKHLKPGLKFWHELAHCHAFTVDRGHLHHIIAYICGPMCLWPPLKCGLRNHPGYIHACQQRCLLLMLSIKTHFSAFVWLSQVSRKQQFPELHDWRVWKTGKTEVLRIAARIWGKQKGRWQLYPEG